MSMPRVVERDPVRLLAAKAGAGATGILNAVRGKHRRLICLEQGRIVFALSNMLEEQFDEELVRKEILNPAQRAEAKIACATQKQKLTEAIEALGLLEPDALRRSLADYVRWITTSTLEWTGSECSFEEGRPNLDGEITVSLCPVTVVLEHVRYYPRSVEEVRVRIGPPNIRPARTERARDLTEDVPLAEAARTLLEGCDGTRDIGALLEQSKHGTEEVLRPLYGFLLLGIVEPAEEKVEVAGATRSQVRREEVLARMHQAQNADHYLVLGVEPRAPEHEIRDGYYFLARRFHPDRFSTGPLKDLRPNIEAYFAQVTEAYNTLSDPELRKQYDKDLASRAVKKEEPKQDTAYLARENYARGKLMLDKGRLQDAVTFLENAIRLDDSKAIYHLELGRVLIRNPRRREDAEQHLRRAAVLDPTSAPTFVAQGQLFLRLGRREDAVRAFHEALRWEPGNVEAKKGLDEAE